jgi:hypothetical protein
MLLCSNFRDLKGAVIVNLSGDIQDWSQCLGLGSFSSNDANIYKFCLT